MTSLNLILNAAPAGGGTGNFLVMMGLMVIVMYFFMIRPQQKKVKAQKLFIEGLKKGDKIITTGGIHGKVISIENTTLIIDSEGTRMKIEKSAVSADYSISANKADATEPAKTA